MRLDLFDFKTCGCDVDYKTKILKLFSSVHQIEVYHSYSQIFEELSLNHFAFHVKNKIEFANPFDVAFVFP